MTEQTQERRTNYLAGVFQVVIGLAVLLLVILLIRIALVRLDQVSDRNDLPEITGEASNEDVLQQALDAERRADEAVASAELILSLLEGASFLVTVALGAAALFGFQEIRNNNQQLDAKMREIDDTLRQFEPYKASLFGLDQLQQALRNDIRSVVKLLQAYQEFSQSQNYDIAYQYAHSVLSRPDGAYGDEVGTEILDNAVALYMAGWLEVHHITGKLDEGIEHLRRAMEMEPTWATVQAAYGVGLRRKAIRTENPAEKRKLYDDAARELRIALERSPSLTDFNKESFHGPLGGIYRDIEQFDKAIHEYEEALRITPGSSYPKGNLASLYLWQATRDNDEQMMAKALRNFRETYQAAQSELREAPGGYYLLMDLSMSMMVMSYEEQKNIDLSFRHLEEALHVDASCGMLEVSLGGWERLLAYCPHSDDWLLIRENIREAIGKVRQRMLEAGCAEIVGMG